MNLLVLVVIGRVGDRREVKNRIELFIAELLAPIEHGEVLRNEISSISSEVLEISRAEIIDHGQARVREFFLQREREVRADKAGPAGYEKIAG